MIFYSTNYILIDFRSTSNNGARVNSYYAENKLIGPDNAVQVELDFSKSVNIIIDGGNFKVVLTVPPATILSVCNVAPADESQCWTCSCECSGQFV
jgi:hypothetical protein